MLDLSGSYLKMDKSTLLTLRTFCQNFNPTTTPTNGPVFRVIKQDTSKGIGRHLVIVKSFALPALQDMHDALPRYTKIIRPKVTTLIDGVLKTDQRIVSRAYMATGINIKGYVIVDNNAQVHSFMTNYSNMVVFQENLNLNADSPYDNLSQLQNITDSNSNGSVEDESAQFFLPYNTVNAGYIGLCFSITDMANMSDSLMDVMVANTPTYFAVRQDAVFEPVRGFTKSDGSPLRYTGQTTSTMVVDGVSHTITTWDFRSYIQTDSNGKVVDTTIQSDGSDGILNFSSGAYTSDSDTYLPNGGFFNGFIGGYYSENFDLFLRKTAKRSQSVFQTMLDLVNSIQTRSNASTNSFTEYLTNTTLAPNIDYWNKLKAQLVYIRDNIGTVGDAYNQLLPSIVDRTSKDSTGLQTTSFPDIIRDRVDLVVGLNFTDDSTEVDTQNWFVAPNPNFAVDLDMDDVTKVKYNEDAIRLSCLNIIFTRNGERFGNQEFGTPILDTLFETRNINVDVLKDMIVQKINLYEPRVMAVRDLIDIQYAGNGTQQLNISAVFYIKQSAQAFLLNKTILL